MCMVVSCCWIHAFPASCVSATTSLISHHKRCWKVCCMMQWFVLTMLSATFYLSISHRHGCVCSYDKAKTDLSTALATLNTHLEGKKFLVNDSVTLADIAVASALVYPFKLVCDEDYRKSFPNVMKWFDACVSQEEFKAVIGSVTLCKKELTAAGQKQ